MNFQIKKTTQKITQSIRTMDLHIQKGAYMTLGGVLTKGWQARTHLRVFLDGEYSRFDCFFCIIGFGAQVFPFNISVIHRASHTVSLVAIRSLLLDESKIDSHGLARVERDAHDARASYSHHALLLSEHSSVRVLPTLEIYTDSVRAHHAASVSQLDADALWYLMSRGINGKNATALLVDAFLRQDIQTIEDISLQKKLLQKIHTAYSIYA